MERSGEQTSLKGLIQGMIPDSMGVVMGKVVSASPLKIQVVNDDKLLLTENLICLPRHLSDYTTTATFTVGRGSLNSVTTVSGNHEHSGGSHGGHTGGSGEHEHGAGPHNHPLASFTLTQGTLTVHNALRVGETVYLLSFNEGKKYYVLDREV